MKSFSLFILMTLVTAFCLPLTITASPADASAQIVTLDVCSAGHDASAGDFPPAVQDHPNSLLKPEFSEYMLIADPHCMLSPVVFPLDHPPRH